MVINTERLKIRALVMNDLDTVIKYALDYENIPYMECLPMNSVDEVSNFLGEVEAEWKKEVPNFYEFAVCVDNTHIGTVSVYLNKNRTDGELGWVFQKEYWGNGYATEAAKALCDFSINELKLKRIYAECDADNLASSNIMRKIGLFLEDNTTMRKNKSADYKTNNLIFSLLI